MRSLRRRTLGTHRWQRHPCAASSCHDRLLALQMRRLQRWTGHGTGHDLRRLVHRMRRHSLGRWLRLLLLRRWRRCRDVMIGQLRQADRLHQLLLVLLLQLLLLLTGYNIGVRLDLHNFATRHRHLVDDGSLPADHVLLHLLLLLLLLRMQVMLLLMLLLLLRVHHLLLHGCYGTLVQNRLLLLL